jgi:hypothetical protein
MDLSMRVSSFRGVHRLTVAARPRTAAALGEHMLLDGHQLEGLSPEPSAREVLRACFTAVAAVLDARDAAAVD